jgi:hypothetical protein
MALLKPLMRLALMLSPLALGKSFFIFASIQPIVYGLTLAMNILAAGVNLVVGAVNWLINEVTELIKKIPGIEQVTG